MQEGKVNRSCTWRPGPSGAVLLKWLLIKLTVITRGEPDVDFSVFADADVGIL